MTDNFDWNQIDKNEKVVNAARETAAYLNTEGDVVIRQRADWPNEQEDSCLIIPLYRVRALIDRLDALLLEAHAAPCPNADSSKP